MPFGEAVEEFIDIASIHRVERSEVNVLQIKSAHSLRCVSGHLYYEICLFLALCAVDVFLLGHC